MERIAAHGNDIWQGLAVAAIVGAALLSFAGKYLPARWRARLAAVFTRNGTRASKLAAWINPQSAGCGDGCSSCGSCETPTPPAADRNGRQVIQLHKLR